MKTLPLPVMRFSLASRMVMVMLLLLLLIQAAGYLAVRQALEQQARSELASKLVVGERVWQRLLAQKQQRLREASAVLAADFGFRAAVSSADQETIVSALENSASRIGASMSALLNPEFEIMGVGYRRDKSAMADATLHDLGAAIAKAKQSGSIAVVQGQVYQFVLVPVRAPVVVGWVLMGFPLDQAQALDYFGLSGIHVAVLSEEGTTLQQVATTLPQTGSGVPDAIRDRLPELVINGETYLARYSSSNAFGGQVITVLMSSLDAGMQPLQHLALELGGITLLGVLLFAIGSDRAARRVTRPLTELTEAAAVMEHGSFDIEVGNTHLPDEVGQLARGFDKMRLSLAAQREEILRLAYWDRLTGLANRERFREILRSAIDNSRDIAKPLVVITLNIDRFKHVNDVLGYALGDELLKAVAGRLQEQVMRVDDLVARLGGDEFAILLTRADAQGAVKLTRRIAEAFEKPLELEDQTVDLSASMGVACWPADGDDADAVMSRSEIAMHAAKAQTAGVLMYAPSLDSSSAQTLSLLTDLRQALQNHELRLFLQPKLSTRTGAVVAAEALVRWQHPQRGLVPPLQFIPFAEQTGFVRQLTLWIFEEVARQWHSLQPAEGHLRVAINLSTRDLLDVDFPVRLEKLMQAYQVQAGAYCLEITESAIMDDPQRANATLLKLSEMGFKLSIDDFGTGYSSLAYLKSLPVNELKIDKSFVMGMISDESDEKIVRSTIDLAHNLGLTVVAEGVEDQTILDRLRVLNCDEAQGYFVSRPMPSEGFNRWREEWLAAHPVRTTG